IFVRQPPMRMHQLSLTVLLLSALGCTTPRPELTSTPGSTSCAGVLSADSTVYDLAQVTEKPIRRTGPAPRYPPGAEQKRVPGSVLLDAIVEPTGVVNSSLITVVSASDSTFARAAADALSGTHFWPACRGGSAVRVRIHFPFQFSIAPEGAA